MKPKQHIQAPVARKRFGQHFLTDGSVIEQILSAAAFTESDCVVEIGPGRGALTIPLLARIDKLHAIELDRDLAPRLLDFPGAREKLTVHCADALKFDFSQFDCESGVHLIGNLPYNISTPLLFHLFAVPARVASMLFMLQREVVTRLAASPGSREYGRLSVAAQFHCQIEPLFDVPPSAFAPPPKVDSSVVALFPRKVPPADIGDINTFSRLLALAFAQRRKTLRNNVKEVLSDQQIENCGIDPSARAETLTLQQFADLSRTLHEIQLVTPHGSSR